MTDRVSSGTTVTAVITVEFCRNEGVRCKRTDDLLENSVLILHDNARPHNGKVVRELLDRYSWEVLPHPPYSPDMSPPDFDLFPKLKINMRSVCFSTLQDLSASATRRVRQLNCSTDLTVSWTFQNVGMQPFDRRGTIRTIRTKILSRTSGILFCRYCVLCIYFEITLVYH